MDRAGTDSKSQYVYPFLGKAPIWGRLIPRQRLLSTSKTHRARGAKTHRIWARGGAPSPNPMSFLGG
eukprot:1522-Prymnesium_polylepis.1